MLYIVYKKLDNRKAFRYGLNWFLNDIVLSVLAVVKKSASLKLIRQYCENTPTDCTIKNVVNIITITGHV